jgi:hypothetical protein
MVHLVKWVLYFLSGAKQLGSDIYHPHPSSAKIKEKVEYTSTPPLGSGFGGLVVSMLAEAVGFFRAKKSSACLPSEGK